MFFSLLLSALAIALSYYVYPLFISSLMKFNLSCALLIKSIFSTLLFKDPFKYFCNADLVIRNCFSVEMSLLLFALGGSFVGYSSFIGYSRSGLEIYYSMLFWHLQFLLQILMCLSPRQTIYYLNLAYQNYLFILR